ncbi:protein boule-like [Lineus longissimus]|uniref:protein boule-like n=1 Tax=Lineus longissimus TaxID=88925 RepID=UPI00315C4D1E
MADSFFLPQSHQRQMQPMPSLGLQQQHSYNCQSSSGEVSPSSTPVSGITSTHAPKYGTVIPNRIFVGGIAANTSESELKLFFQSYGSVKDSKIIADRAGVSKGYGFITFDTQEDAEKIIKKESDNLVFKDRKLNIGPAIRKQQAFPRPETSFSPSTVLFTNGSIPYTYQNGMAVFSQDGSGQVYQAAQTQPTYPVMAVPQHVAYAMTQPQYSAYQPHPHTPQTWASAAQAAASQWRWQSPTPAAMASSPGAYLSYPTMQPAAAPEMMYAQPPPQAYQQEMPEAGLMEPTEGSMGPIEHRQCIAEQQISYVDQNGMPLQQVPAHMQTPQPAHKTVPSVASSYYQVPKAQPSPRKHYSTPMPMMRGGKVPRLIRKEVNGTTINVMPQQNVPLETTIPQHEYECYEVNHQAPPTPPPTPQQLHCK